MQPLGSVLELDARRYVVVGHRITRDGEVMAPGYLVVPYPLGFVDPESIQVVPASAFGAVVHEGYANDEGDAYLEEFAALAEASAGVPYTEYEASVRLLADFAREEGGHDR